MNNLEKLLEKLRRYRWCHNKTSKYYSNRNKLFTIPPIIFSSASSFVILESHESNATYYASAALSMASAMLSGVSLHLGFNAKSECHLMSANSYDELITKIDIFINFKQGDDNESEKDLIEYVEERILKIKSNNKYQIPQWVFDLHTDSYTDTNDQHTQTNHNFNTSYI